MANPNIVNVSSIYGNIKGVGLTTNTSSGILTCGAGKIIKINAATAAGIGTDETDITVSVYDSSASSSYYIAGNIPVPANSTFVVIGKDNTIYLNESDEIRAGASADSSLDFVISYEEIS